jgi:DNA-binding beta-propeller fold protein YncE
VDATDAIWIADTGNQRIRKVSNGIITTVVVATAPQAIAVDSSGEAFFADDNRIRVLTPSASPTPASPDRDDLF